MENRTVAYNKIKREITEDIPEVRERFIAVFNKETDQFVLFMTDAFLDWQQLDSKIGIDEKLAHVSGLVYSAMTLHILSMKLFMSGQIIAAGNLEHGDAHEIMRMFYERSAGGKETHEISSR